MWREVARMKRSRLAASRGRDVEPDSPRGEEVPQVEMIAVTAEDRVRGQKTATISK